MDQAQQHHGSRGQDPGLGQPPLSDVRVLELGHIVAGPSVGQTLGDLGADVVKIESPSGDGLRTWPPVVGTDEDGYSLNFAVINRNKRSVVLDLKTIDGRATLSKLIENADVVVENFRPGTLARIGIDVEAVCEDTPRLIWCSVSGFGQDGPMATSGAYDVVIQGYSGMMSVTGEPGGAPLKCGVPVGDFVAGLYAAVTISAALRRREITGEGAVLDCSMVGSLLAISALQVSQFLGTGADPEALGSGHPRNAPYQAYQCSDRYITVAAGNDRLWRRFCGVVGRPELADDVRFLHVGDRATNQAALFDEIEPVLVEKPSAHWLARFGEAGVPCGPVNTFGEALADQQIEHLNLLRDLKLPNGDVTKGVSYPVRTRSWRDELGPPPGLGEHTAEVIEEWT